MEQKLVISRRIALVLGVIGLLISAYLTYTHFTNTSVQCLGGSNECTTVQESTYSSVAGIPVALLGLLGYLGILGMLFLEERRAQFSEYAPLTVFGMTLAGVAYSAYLTYLELAVIYAICQYCVASAVIMTALFGIAIYRLVLTNQE